jgi:hypothetical protein
MTARITLIANAVRDALNAADGFSQEFTAEVRYRRAARPA